MQSLTENGKLAVPETGQKAAGLGLSVRSRTLIGVYENVDRVQVRGRACKIR